MHTYTMGLIGPPMEVPPVCCVVCVFTSIFCTALVMTILGGQCLRTDAYYNCGGTYERSEILLGMGLALFAIICLSICLGIWLGKKIQKENEGEVYHNIENNIL